MYGYEQLEAIIRGSDLSVMVQAIVSTGFAIFHGVWLVFRWAFRKESEERENQRLRELDCLTYHISAQEDCLAAMPLGEGYTAEEQITTEAQFGGLQIIAYPLKAELYNKLLEQHKKEQKESMLYSRMAFDLDRACVMDSSASMGFAPGGLMTQTIHEDTYGIDAWDTDSGSRCFVHVFNSGQWRAITGAQPPTKSRKAQDYEAAGLPWFEYYSDGKALRGSSVPAGLDSLAAKTIKKGKGVLQGNKSLEPGTTKCIDSEHQGVSEGDWS